MKQIFFLISKVSLSVKDLPEVLDIADVTSAVLDVVIVLALKHWLVTRRLPDVTRCCLFKWLMRSYTCFSASLPSFSFNFLRCSCWSGRSLGCFVVGQPIFSCR